MPLGPWARLPEDLLCFVCEFLDPGVAFGRLALVSRPWFLAVHSAQHWRALHELRMQRLPRSVTAGDDQLRALFMKWRSLTQLTLVRDATDAVLREVGACCAELQVFRAVDCDRITDAGLACLHPLSRLERLYLSGCHNVTDEAVAGLVARCPRLVRVGLCATRIQAHATSAALAANCKWLTAVALDGCARVDTEALRVLSEGRERGGGCEALETIGLRDCWNVKDEGGWGPRPRLTTAPPRALTSARLCAGLRYLAAQCPRLRDISVAHCTAITDTGIASLGLTHLESLDVSGCKLVSAGALVGLVRTCASLVRLSAAGCSGIDDSVLHAVSARGGFVHLNIAHCNRVTDKGESYLRTRERSR